MSTDWAAQTTAWVDDGLIEADQRDALLERLVALPTGSAMALGPLITVLVAPATFLLIGSAVALLAATVDPPKEAYDLLIGASATALVLLGAVLRFVPSVRPLARGVLAAAIPMATYVMMSTTYGTKPAALALLAIVPAAMGWVGGWLENSRAITASGALMTLIATSAAMHAMNALRAEPASIVVALASLLGLVVITVLAKERPERSAVLQVGSPALVVLGVEMLTANGGYFEPWLSTITARSAWEIEKGLLILLFGTLTLAIGLAGRSAWTVVPGIGCIAFSTVWIAFTFGSFLGGAIALAAVSISLFVGAVMLWLLPWIRSQGPRPA